MQRLFCIGASLAALPTGAVAASQLLRSVSTQLAKDSAPADVAMAAALCASRPPTHICDPGHLLSQTNLAEHSSELQRLASPGGVLIAGAGPGQKALPSACPERGYEVYVVVLDVPADAVRATAAALGQRWGVLGGECSNGVVALYSASDRVLAISADRLLEERALPPRLEGIVERSSLGGPQSSPEEVVSTLVTKLTLALHGEISIFRPTLMESSAEFLLYSVTSCVALAASVLMMCCLYDTASQWRHRAHFHNCKQKVKRVHEVLLSRHGELPLCPHCVEYVSNQPSPQVVVFLCGHRFHMECANSWLGRQEGTAGSCPICEPRKTAEEAGIEDGDCERSSLCSHDEAKPFFLRSLSRQFPEIIDKDCVRRWRECHTEIWLSELNCPRYNSIFHYQK